MVTRALAACGLAGTLLFTVTWVVAGLRDPGFSFVDNDTSDLGALTAAHPLPYNVALSVSGLLTLGLAVALVRVLPRHRLVVVGAVLVAVFSVGQAIDGLAREDCPVSVDARCRAAEKAGEISTHHMVHNIESIFTFSALVLSAVVLWRVLRRLPRWRGLAWWGLASAAVQVVCLPIFLTMYTNGAGGQGLVEIAEVTAGSAWLAALSIAILRRHGDGPAPTGPAASAA